MTVSTRRVWRAAALTLLLVRVITVAAAVAIPPADRNPALRNRRAWRRPCESPPYPEERELSCPNPSGPGQAPGQLRTA